MTVRVLGELRQPCTSPAPPVTEEKGESGPGRAAGKDGGAAALQGPAGRAEMLPTGVSLSPQPAPGGLGKRSSQPCPTGAHLVEMSNQRALDHVEVRFEEGRQGKGLLAEVSLSWGRFV